MEFDLLNLITIKKTCDMSDAGTLVPRDMLWEREATVHIITLYKHGGIGFCQWWVVTYEINKYKLEFMMGVSAWSMWA